MATFEIITAAAIGGGGGSSFLVYKALLTQSGEDDPTAIVLENTLGGTVVWTRNGAGQYFGTLTDGFTNDKTLGFAGGDMVEDNNVFYCVCQRENTNAMKLVTFDDGGIPVDVFTKISVSIEVYP